MGWKTINGRRYYYQSVREGSRVRSEYYGAELGEMVAELARHNRIRSNLRKVKERDDRERWDRIGTALDGLAQSTRSDAEAILNANGYHKHNRSEWRRRRVTNSTAIAASPKPNPQSISTRMVTALLVDGVVGKEADDEAKRAIRREIREYASSFAGPAPTAIETVLAETAALALFALRSFEAEYASRRASGELSIAQSKHFLNKIEHAQRRLESALRTLATVRRLAMPAVQINVARHQVNQQVISGTSPA